MSRQWIDQGRLPALRIGCRVRTRREHFTALTEEHCTPAPAPSRGFDARAFWDGGPLPPPAWASET